MRLPTRLLRRKIQSHKGDFGHIFVLAGSVNYTGAAVLTCASAMRSGAGLVTLGIPRSLSSAVIKIKPLEVIIEPLPQTAHQTISAAAFRRVNDLLKKCDVLIVGPGLSQNKSTQSLIRRVIKDCDKPMVIDADALNALAGHLNILRNTQNAERNTILTPHPVELSRLLGLALEKIQGNREIVAKRAAIDYNLTVVLKGHNTVVADHRGNTYINKTGNPGMASAGSGDVLAGMIGAFLGQGLDAFNAAKYAVYLHGLAGDLAAKEKTQISLIASDIVDKIPEAIKKCT